MHLFAPSSLHITPYQRRNLSLIRDMLFHSRWSHTHFDWHEADGWLESGESVTKLLWLRGRLAGVMGLSKPLNGASWIRLLVVAERHDPNEVLPSLWLEFVPELRAQGVHTVGLLLSNEWLLPYATQLGFQCEDEIVTLARAGYQLPEAPAQFPVIRLGEIRDLDAMTLVDQAAFAPPWQMSKEEMRQAYRIASSCTVALHQEQVVGFQISTLFFDGAHLARLAVAPHMQGMHIGQALLHDLLERFARRGIYMMTVNTQASNIRARGLYTRYDFHLNGYDIPFWSLRL